MDHDYGYISASKFAVWYTYGQHTRARSQGQRNIFDWVMYEAVRQCIARTLDRPISTLLSREMLEAKHWRAREEELARYAMEESESYSYSLDADGYGMYGGYVDWDP